MHGEIQVLEDHLSTKIFCPRRQKSDNPVSQFFRIHDLAAGLHRQLARQHEVVHHGAHVMLQNLMQFVATHGHRPSPLVGSLPKLMLGKGRPGAGIHARQRVGNLAKQNSGTLYAGCALYHQTPILARPRCSTQHGGTAQNHDANQRHHVQSGLHPICPFCILHGTALPTNVLLTVNA